MMKMADENSGDTQVWLDLASAQHWGGVGVHFLSLAQPRVPLADYMEEPQWGLLHSWLPYYQLKLQEEVVLWNYNLCVCNVNIR